VRGCARCVKALRAPDVPDIRDGPLPRRRLETAAMSLAELLRSIKQHHKACLGTGDIHFVAHSYGSIVLRTALRHVCLKDHNCRTVLVGPCSRG
jgi:hypothetical protein